MALPRPTELSPLFQCERSNRLWREHVVESLCFLFYVIAKDLHAILASTEPQQIIDLSVHKGGIITESRGNVAVIFPGVRIFGMQFGLIL